MGDSVRRAVEGSGLEVRHLGETETAELRQRALGEQPLWQPTLLSVDGEKVRAWTGNALSRRLARLLGPVKSVRVVRAMAQDEPVSTDRRRVLAAIPGAAVAGVALSGGVAFAGDKSQDLSGEQARAIAVVRGLPEFRAVEEEQHSSTGTRFNFSDAEVQVQDGQAVVVVAAIDRQRSVVAKLVVDIENRDVRFAQFMTSTRQDDDSAELVVEQRGEVVFRGTVNQSGLSGFSGFEDRAAEATQRAADGTGSDATAMGVCEWAVGALCGTGGGVGCYLTCAAIGATTFGAGLGCAAVCSLIGALGCTGATIAICG